jgi:translocation and assembly module TamB
MIKRILIFLFLGLLALLGGIAWIVGTESGFDFVVEKAQTLAPGELKIENHEGRLIDKISLTGISYQKDELTAQVDTFVFDWNANALLETKVHVEQLHIDNVKVHLPKTEPEEKDEEAGPLELPSIQLPVQIAIDDVQIKQVSVQTGDAEPFIIDSVELRSTTTDVLSLQHFTVDSPQFNVKLAGDVGLMAPHTIQLDLDWSAQLPDFTVVGQGALSGDIEQLILTHTVSKPLEIELQSTVTDVLGALNMEVELTWQEVYWPFKPPVPKDYLVHSEQGRLTVTGSLENYQVNLTTNVAGQQIPAGHWTIAAQGNQQAVTLDKLQAKLLKGVISATGNASWQPKLAGQLNLNVAEITLQDLWPAWPRELSLNSQVIAQLDADQFKVEQIEVTIPQTGAKVALQAEGVQAGEKSSFKRAQLTWQNLQWPLVKEKNEALLVSSSKGQVNLAGPLQDYQVDLRTQIAGAQFPPGQVTLAGRGSLEQFTVESLRTDILKGAVNVTGKIGWKPKLLAQLNLNAANITIQDFWADWPSNLTINSQLKAHLNDKDFKISTLNLEIPQTAAQISLTGEGNLAEPGPTFKNVNLAWQKLQWPLIGKETVVNSQQGQVNLTGRLQNYRVNLNTQLAGAQITPSFVTAKGQGNLEQFTLQNLNTEIFKGAVNATGQIAWKPTLRGQFQLDVDSITVKDLWKEWPAHLRVNSQLVAHLDDKKFQLQTLKVNIPQTGAQLALQGNGTLNGEKTRFNTSLTWKNLQWPLVGKDILVNTPTGKLGAKGSVQAYQLNLNTQIQGKDIPNGRWQAKGTGDSQSLQLKSLQGKILQGVLNLSGKVRWQPKVSWQLALQGQNLNPGTQWAELPGKIRLDIRSQGQLRKDGSLEAQVDVKHIKGKLRNYPLQFQTRLAITDNDYNIKKLQLKSGKNRLFVNGKLGQTRSNLDWTLNVPNLASFLPEGQGRLTGKGRIRGPLNLPHIQANLKGHGLAFQDKRLKTLHADVNVDLRNQQDLFLELVANDLKQGDSTLVKQLKIQGQGRIDQHDLTAYVKTATDNFSLKLRGGYKQPRWQGRLQDIIVATETYGYWKLQDPTKLSLSATEAQLAQSCVKDTQRANICTQLHWQKEADSTVKLSINQLPLGLTKALLQSKNMDISGTLGSQITATLQPDGALRSDITLNLSPGKVTMGVADEAQQLSYQGGSFKLQVTRQGLAANLNFSLLDQSGLQGSFNMPRFTHIPPQGEQPIQGRIKATFADLSILPLFVPQLENVQGEVNVDITPSGTLTAPQLRGEIRVQDVAMELPDLGLELKKLNVSILGKGRELQMQAGVNSGEGQLNLKGKAQLRTFTDWQAALKMTGKNFTVIDTAEAWVLASPNMDIKMVPKRIDVTGEVTIPEAAITPPQASSSAVAVSKDVIIVNPKHPVPQEKPKTAPPTAIYTNVKVILGDNVTFEGAGFKSRFGGTLIATAEPLPTTIGNGELYILDGSYKAYGQNLQIDKGRIFFSGGPVENPGLDIRAYRYIKRRQLGEDDIIAGVYIHGTAQAPLLDLYSQPPLDQSNTLSYIILGKPAAQASGSEGDLLLAAAVSLPLGKANTIAQKIGKDLGLDDAGIQSDDTLGQAALVVGKYLTPGLYISYGVGLFDGANVLRMRYELTKNLNLETETGTQSGIDLRYTIEW